ncbi:MAG: SagB/ThcOx family dehydrogenase [Desulfobacterales bacterium]|nr:SagB/ThcOx family dehydrogenase [Desulfobacterales bacterium]
MYWNVFSLSFLCRLILIGIVVVGLLLSMPMFVEKGGYAMEKPPEKPLIDLPAPRTDGASALEKALNERRSVRHYTDRPLTLAHIGQLLWAAQGITNSRGFRTAPSAGALYPLEIYLVAGKAEKINPGIYHYRPAGHQLEQVKAGDHRKAVCDAALSQSAVRNAPVSIIITGVLERTTAKYGKRGIQYVFMEAGHAAQNVLLQAVSLNLGAVPIGAFQNEALGRILGPSESERPLYILCIGHPAAR